MSRSGYSDDGDNCNLWRGAVDRAIEGKRGQQFLKDLLAALDGMADKKLISEELELGGEFCTLGAIGKARGVDVTDIDPEDSQRIAKLFNIANAMACEIVYMNDEAYIGSNWREEEKPENRWVRMREWVVSKIKGGNA